MFQLLIVIPTYNEKSNIGLLIENMKRHKIQADVLVVDDNSPDQTGDFVQGLTSVHSNIFLLRRQQKEGLGRAYVDGFHWALAKNYSHILQMDADHSHRVEDLPAIIQAAQQGADFVVGSRWCRGGAIKNWSLFRRLLSQMGNLYVRMILGGQVRDWTGGFNLWNSKVLSAVQLSSLESLGYAFQIELKYRAFGLKFSGIEVPIIFEERRAGQSKMSSRIIIEALLRVWKLKSKFTPNT